MNLRFIRVHTFNLFISVKSMFRMRHFLIFAFFLSMATTMFAQSNLQNLKTREIEEGPDSVIILPWFDDEIDLDSLNLDFLEVDTLPVTPPRKHSTLSNSAYRPIVFDQYHFLDTFTISERNREEYTGDAFYWLDDLDFSQLLIDHARQSFIVNNPCLIKYDVASLPEKPKGYQGFVDPTTAKIVLQENKPTVDKSQAAKDIGASVERKNWIYDFNTNFQFSQAYISPNWYQGGNDNMQLLTSSRYYVKINEKFHPKILFDATFQYKLGLNNAPNDTLRSYNIIQDVFEVYTNFGYKAIKRWYYSINGNMRTQLFNSYGSNSNVLRSSFLSPGEFNIGVGMTYNYSNPKVSLNATISPLSWNMKSCINSKLNETNFGIDEGHTTKSSYGSKADITFSWQIAYNINYRSRLYMFTNYDYAEANYDHTFSFNINKFLSSQININMRYDSNSRRLEDSSWHKFQLKETLSFGLTYQIKNT